MSNNENLQGEDSLKRVLKKRAEDLAQAIESDEYIETSMVLTFTIGNNERYALPYQDTYKVCNIETITKVPASNPIFLGLVYLNSEVWPVLNMNMLLHINDENRKDPELLILLKQNNQKIALAIHQIIGLLPFDGDVKLTQDVKDASKTIITGIYHSEIAVLNTDSLFHEIINYNVNMN